MFGLYWIISISIFLVVGQFKIPQIIFLLYSMYFMMNPQHLCSNGICAVYHILTPPPTEVFYWVYLYTTLVPYMYSMINQSLAHTLAPSPAKESYMNLYCT